MTDESPPTLPVLMGRVLADVADVGKTEKAPANMGGYSFRGIEGILGALKPALAAHGVFCLPCVVERRDDVRSVSGGKSMFVIDLYVEWTFYGPAGDTLTAACWGQGTDMGDKSIQKAMTSAFKSMLTQTFCIGDSGTDSERHDVPQTDQGNGDPEKWFRANGWESKAAHDERRRLIADELAALGEGSKRTFAEWWADQATPWTSAWTRDIADRAAATLAHLNADSGPPASETGKGAHKAPEAAPGPSEAVSGDPGTIGDLIGAQSEDEELCSQCEAPILPDHKKPPMAMRAAVGEDGKMYHRCHVPFPDADTVAP